MALGPQSARDRQLANQFSREFGSRATLAGAVSALTTGQIVYAAGRRYRVDPVGPDGLCIVERSWKGAFEQLQHRMQDGQAVRFACFGDSTTDGSQTTDWTPNPTNGEGEAVGNAAHNPPNAWPAFLRTIIRRMYSNQGIQMWNAGYGGRAIVDEWARNNFARAVINNPAYGTPDACLINFGLNDITRGVYTPGLFYTELVYLVNLLDFYNIVPIFVTPDPVVQGTARQGGSISELMSVYERVAEQFGIKVIDAHVALTEVFSSGGTNYLWGFNQDDNLHFGDTGHRVKASYIAAELFNKTLFVAPGTENLNIASFSKYANTQDLAYSVYDEANNRFGVSLNVSPGTYTAGQVLIDVWVWCPTDELDAYWRSLSGDGYYRPRPLADAPEIEIGDYLRGFNITTKSPTAGQVQQIAPNRDAEVPAYLGAVTAGLTRLTFKAPTDNNAEVIFLGYFQLKRTRLPLTVSTFWATSGSGNVVYDPDVYEARAALLGYGFTRAIRMLFDVRMPNGCGVFLWSGRVFADGTAGVSQRRRGIVLMRNGANIQLLNVAYTASGDVAVAVLATEAYTWDEGEHEFTVRASVGSGNYNIQITPAATPLAPVLTVSVPVTDAPLALGGHFGAFYKSHGVSPAAGRACCTLHELFQA